MTNPSLPTKVELRGRTALVTGGAVRMGRVLACALADAGMRVIVHYGHSADEAEQVVRSIRASGGDAVSLQANLAEAGEVERLARDAEEVWDGGVDVLVNSAASFHPERIEDTEASLWDSVLGVNLRAPFLLIRQFGPAMRRRGRGVIVNISDLAGVQAWRGYAAHGVSKAGLIHLTRVAAREFAPEVRVVAIAPGTVLPPEDTSAEELQRLADRAPLGRIGEPDDVVRALLYLLGAPFVTGEVLHVDGGRALRG